MAAGIAPLRLFCCRIMNSRTGKELTQSGMSPDKLLWPMFIRVNKGVLLNKSIGMDPLR